MNGDGYGEPEVGASAPRGRNLTGPGAEEGARERDGSSFVPSSAIRRLAEKCLKRVSGVSMTGGVRDFMRNLGVIMVCFGVARVLSATANILVARQLGPSEYGNSLLVITVSQLFSVPALFGMNAAIVRYGAGEQKPHRIMSTSFWTVMSLSVATAAVFALASNPLQAFLAVPSPVFWLGLALGILYSLLIITGAGLQTCGRFLLRGIMEICVSGVFLCAVVVALFAGERTFKGAALSYILAYGVTVLAGALPVARYYYPRHFDTGALRAMMPFASYNFMCGLGFFFIYGFQRSVLNLFCSEKDVGVFGLYSLASINQACFAGSLVSTVLFPKAAASNNRSGIWGVSVRTWTWALLPFFCLVSVGQIIVLLLSGDGYPWDPVMIALLSAASCAILIQSCLGQIIGAEGERGAKLGMLMSIAMGIVAIELSCIFIPLLGVRGAAVSLAISYSLAIAWLTAVKHRYL